MRKKKISSVKLCQTDMIWYIMEIERIKLIQNFKFRRTRVSGSRLGAEQWSRFRGSSGADISNANTVPIKWTEKDYNWKVRLPGVGYC